MNMESAVTRLTTVESCYMNSTEIEVLSTERHVQTSKSRCKVQAPLGEEEATQ